MATDHDMRMEALRLFEENEKLRTILAGVDHTLTVHGKIDADTDLHKRVQTALAKSE